MVTEEMGGWNRTWLGPSQFHSRVPFFAAINGTTITGVSDTQAVCDAEIQMAYDAGFDYFAYAFQCDEDDFLYAGAGNDPRCTWLGANDALTLHRSSSRKTLVKWCMNLVADRGAGAAEYGLGGTWVPVRNYMVTAMQESGYMTVLSGRPLLYIYQPDDWVANVCGNVTNATNTISDLRTQVQNAMGKNPYIVGLSTNAALTHVNDIGLDAAGRYSVLAGSVNETYSTFKTRMEGTWATDASAHTHIVPNCSTGINYEPISTTYIPGSYAGALGGGGEADHGPYCAAPTVTEAKNHIQAAIDYIAAHPSTCPADTLGIYSFSEPTEAAYSLWPDHGDYTAPKIQAIGAALGRKRRHFNMAQIGDGTLTATYNLRLPPKLRRRRLRPDAR